MSNTHATGPRTAQGKAVVSRNACKHNLTSVQIVIAGEDRELFNQLLHESVIDLRPSGHTQHALVEQVAFAEWKLLRIAQWESQIVNAALARKEAPAQRLFGKTPDEALARLHRYESQVRRAFHAALRELRVLQKSAPKVQIQSVAETLYNRLEQKHFFREPEIGETNSLPPSPRNGRRSNGDFIPTSLESDHAI